MNTPYYLIDEAALRRNLEILRGVRERTGCRILLAQKAFSMFAVYPIIAEYLDGATASGLFEARLAAEELHGENHVFSAAYRAGDIPELARLCDHVVFNSCAQLRAYAPQVLAAGKQAGLRINPECSTQEGHAIYDPCGEKSRLGVTRAQFDPEVLPLLSGLQGQATDIKIHADHIIRIRRRMNEMYAQYTGQPLERIEADTERDNFLTAQQAADYGLIDAVTTKR